MSTITEEQDARVEKMASEVGRATYERIANSRDVYVIGLRDDVEAARIRVNAAGLDVTGPVPDMVAAVPPPISAVDVRTLRLSLPRHVKGPHAVVEAIVNYAATAHDSELDGLEAALATVLHQDALPAGELIHRARATTGYQASPSDQARDQLRRATAQAWDLANGEAVDAFGLLSAAVAHFLGYPIVNTREDAERILAEREGTPPEHLEACDTTALIVAANAGMGQPCSDCGAIVVADGDGGWRHVQPSTCFLAQGDPDNMKAMTVEQHDAHHGLRDGEAACPFHPDRPQVRNGMCGPCAEKADDAR